jgi:hypothetical protein
MMEAERLRQPESLEECLAHCHTMIGLESKLRRFEHELLVANFL